MCIRDSYKDGADLLKIMPSGGVLDESASADNPQMTLDEIKAVVAAAHDYGFTAVSYTHLDVYKRQSSGNTTGSWSSGTGTAPQLSLIHI